MSAPPKLFHLSQNSTKTTLKLLQPPAIPSTPQRALAANLAPTALESPISCDVITTPIEPDGIRDPIKPIYTYLLCARIPRSAKRLRAILGEVPKRERASPLELLIDPVLLVP